MPHDPKRHVRFTPKSGHGTRHPRQQKTPELSPEGFRPQLHTVDGSAADLDFPWPGALGHLQPADGLGIDSALRRETKPRRKGCLHAHCLLPEHDLAGLPEKVMSTLF